MKLIYRCKYDGCPCDKEKVQVVDGEVVEPAINNCSYIEASHRGWEVCMHCDRCYSLSPECCRGFVEFAQEG